MIAVIVAVIALGLLKQAIFSLTLMIYAWDRPEQLAATAGPSRFRAPQTSFTILLPAKNEAAVIAETIQQIVSANNRKVSSRRW